MFSTKQIKTVCASIRILHIIQNVCKSKPHRRTHPVDNTYQSFPFPRPPVFECSLENPDLISFGNVVSLVVVGVAMVAVVYDVVVVVVVTF